jgi:hypothetical protein
MSLAPVEAKIQRGIKADAQGLEIVASTAPANPRRAAAAAM